MNLSRYCRCRFAAGVILLLLAGAVLAGPAPAPDKTTGPARLALVSTERGDKVQSILALAQARLSSHPGLQLLDRQAIDRVLAEQKLSLSGLVQSEQVLAAGKLLSVDLFAVLETNPQSKEPVGLVVFDARTGVRLWDGALPGGEIEKAVAGVVRGTEAAVKKQRQNFQGLRTLCLMTVRNVDLPRDRDALCDSVGLLLERELITSPSVVILERSRLDQVNRERSLPTGSPLHPLLASLVTVELEVGRSEDGKGLRAVALLSNSRGQALGKPAASVPGQDVQALAHALLGEVARSLNATPGGGVVDRTREVQRLVREADFYWQHKDYQRGLRAIEAAHALDPDDLAVRGQLAWGLVSRGMDVLEPYHFGTLMTKTPPPQELRASLELVRRGTATLLEVDRLLTDRGVPDDKRDVHLYFSLPSDLSKFLIALARPREPLPAEDVELLDAVKENYRLLLRQKAARAVAAVHDRASFEAYTAKLVGPWTKIGWNFDYPGQSKEDLFEQMNAWMGLAEKYAAPPYSPAYVREFYAILRLLWGQGGADQERLRKLRETMERSDDPFVQVYSRLADLGMELDRKTLTEEEATRRARDFRLFVQQLIAGDKGRNSGELRLVCYQAVNEIIHDLPGLMKPGNLRQPEMTDFCHFMLSRDDLEANVVRSAIFYSKDFSTEGYRRALDVVEQALRVLDSPRCLFLSYSVIRGNQWSVDLERKHLREELVAERNSLLTLHPEFEAKIVTPWQNVRPLIDVLENESGILWVLQPIVHGNYVYTVALAADKPKDRQQYLQLVRFSLLTGDRTLLGKVPVESREQPHPDVEFRAGLHILFARTACIYEGRYYLGTRDRGIFVFSLDGKAAEHIDTARGLPSNDVQGLACVDGKLYAGLGERDKEGYIVSYDLKSGKCTVLASSRRKEKLSPFDDTAPLEMPYVTADPERRRCLFVAYLPPQGKLSGLWQLDARTDQFDRLLPLPNYGVGASDFRWGSPVRDHTIWLETSDNTIEFDLDRNTSRALGGKETGMDRTWPHTRERLEVIAAHADLPKGPLAVGAYDFIWNGWLWSARPFGRTSLDGKWREAFPSLREKYSKYFYPIEVFQLVDDNRRLLVGDQHGLWLLTLDLGKVSATPGPP